MPFAFIMIALLSLTGMPGYSQEVVFKNRGSAGRLIELFSSEGCSSCPPAEAWMSKLQGSPRLWSDLFPVAFHVDYWDGLGWPDRFAKPLYTERQRDYAQRLRQDSVYTPEFVVNGREWRRSFLGADLPSSDNGLGGALTFSTQVEAKTVSAVYQPASSTLAYTLNVALLGFHVTTDVKAGENGGRHLQHDFVVLAFASKPMVAQTGGLEGRLALTSSTDDALGAVVAWVSTSSGSIAQIAGGWLKK
jgi:hypothetical protein